MAVNKVELEGRLTKDPNIFVGKAVVTKFSVAVDKGGKQEGADFINCVCFGDNAEFIGNNLTKGDRIHITNGKIQTGSYESKKTGQRVYTTDVVVWEFKSDKDGSSEESQQGIDEVISEIDDSDDMIPF